ncbi:hypothetical protein TRAPUB_7157 [Trametes pubescens]|uniref:Uncharacterized protein n=1 Tax=Trametes pubescens TaxID=154538 RepID=A0A1M2V435_TRAPU|nr:hypothetical protein TRAPUB_7157 [Trametes pubescens]
MHVNTDDSPTGLPLPTYDVHQDLAALQTTSQDPDMHSPSTSTQPRVRISLPQPQDAFCRIEAPAAYPDIRVLFGDVADGPQTVQRLVMRKRATSPYQIKLPFMADRLRARRSASGGSVPEVVANPQLSGPGTETASTHIGRGVLAQRTNTSTLGGSFSLDHNARVFIPPSRCVIATSHHSETTLSKKTPSSEDAFPPFILHTLSTLDTWSEICGDLSRAMEIFTVLADAAPARFSVFPSQSFSEDLPPPCSFQSHKLDRTPTAPTSPWNSFVFPCFGVA